MINEKIFVLIIIFIFLIIIPVSAKALVNTKLTDRYNNQKDYFDYSVVLLEFPKNYYYTTVKINKSKERILIITDKLN